MNFRSTTKSFKNKKKIDRPPEKWQIFKDTHPAIIDREVFALVQELRKHRRRPTKSGIVSPFSGLLYCADCGEKLYYSVVGILHELPPEEMEEAFQQHLIERNKEKTA